MISIVIPCRNGAATLRAQLDALLHQRTEEAFEVLVADNGSTDSTAALVREVAAIDQRVRLVDASGTAGINHARNAGVTASRGVAVLLCDADDVVQPGWLAAHAAAFRLGAPCVGGAVDRTLADGTVLERTSPLYTTHWSVESPIGANCGFRREVFDRIDGFDETFLGGGDETDFFWRAAAAGYPTIAVPDAIVHYTLREDLRGLARQYFAYGRGTVHLYDIHHAHGMPRPAWWNLPIVLCIGVTQVVLGGRVRRRQGVERLALRAGRINGSLHYRRWYL